MAVDITKAELERAFLRLAEITGNRDNYFPALADDIFRYVEDQRRVPYIVAVERYLLLADAARR
jgi:hypothetical protein